VTSPLEPEFIERWAEGAGVEQVAHSVSTAEQGDADAQINLGVMYFTGRGVPQDYAAPTSWYRKAAEQGDAGAQYRLGVMYAYGHGVPKDYTSAHMSPIEHHRSRPAPPPSHPQRAETSSLHINGRDRAGAYCAAHQVAACAAHQVAAPARQPAKSAHRAQAARWRVGDATNAIVGSKFPISARTGHTVPVVGLYAFAQTRLHPGA
jgi:TPR repeat protein